MNDKNYKNVTFGISNHKKRGFFWDFKVRKALNDQSNTVNRACEKFYIEYVFLKNFFIDLNCLDSFNLISPI